MVDENKNYEYGVPSNFDPDKLFEMRVKALKIFGQLGITRAI